MAKQQNQQNKQNKPKQIPKNSKTIQKNNKPKPNNKNSDSNKNNKIAQNKNQNNKQPVKPQQKKQVQKQNGNKSNNNNKNNKQNKNQNQKKQEKKEENGHIEKGSDDEDEEEENSDIEEDQQNEGEEINEEMRDEALEQLAYGALKKNMETKKQKEKKVMDFKFRVLDLIDIFVKKTQNPELFIQALIPFFEAMKTYSKEKSLANFTDKLSLVLKKFWNKNHQFKVEYKDQIEECISTLMDLLGKTSKKNVQKTFQFSLFALIKIRLEMQKDDKQFEQKLVELFKNALECQTMKRDFFYTEQLFQELYKSYPNIASQLTPYLIQQSNSAEFGGPKDFRRKFAMELLHYVARTSHKENDKLKISEQILEQLQKLIDGVYKNYNDIKHKKYSDLRKYSDILQNYIDQNKENEEIKKLKLSFISTIESWADDSNIKSYREKLLKKLKSE